MVGSGYGRTKVASVSTTDGVVSGSEPMFRCRLLFCLLVFRFPSK